MKREPRKRDFERDSQSGIRRLNQIENLPVKALTDDEVCKLFFARFGADALVMLYIHPKEGLQTFGRAKFKSTAYRFYKRLMEHLDGAFGYAMDQKEIPEEEV